jgi:hypothetical protein
MKRDANPLLNLGYEASLKVKFRTSKLNHQISIFCSNIHLPPLKKKLKFERVLLKILKIITLVNLSFTKVHLKLPTVTKVGEDIKLPL